MLGALRFFCVTRRRHGVLVEFEVRARASRLAPIAITVEFWCLERPWEAREYAGLTAINGSEQLFRAIGMRYGRFYAPYSRDDANGQ